MTDDEPEETFYHADTSTLCTTDAELKVSPTPLQQTDCQNAEVIAPLEEMKDAEPVAVTANTVLPMTGIVPDSALVIEPEVRKVIDNIAETVSTVEAVNVNEPSACEITGEVAPPTSDDTPKPTLCTADNEEEVEPTPIQHVDSPVDMVSVETTEDVPAVEVAAPTHVEPEARKVVDHVTEASSTVDVAEASARSPGRWTLRSRMRGQRQRPLPRMRPLQQRSMSCCRTSLAHLFQRTSGVARPLRLRQTRRHLRLRQHRRLPRLRQHRLHSRLRRPRRHLRLRQPRCLPCLRRRQKPSVRTRCLRRP
ncbi:hypothetical protein EJ06DRAFT_181988 [Trichodelitschia bisporula]|uniref:Uncharacterized protein n=1 Tax=Trichodelitschia bisporula TaxID=703511 RepID=A0A6G1HLU4_9PEZI|nr:hypothetical protein EJ06DRAFT_181988 [Trichodelitschia bisporula]